MAPARPRLRKLLSELLRSDSDLEAFCSDYFPGARDRFTLGMERTHKLTVLLDHADVVAIAEALRRAYPEEAAKIDDALASELRAVESVDRSDGDDEPSRRGAAPSRKGFLVAALVVVAMIAGGAFWRLASRIDGDCVGEALAEPRCSYRGTLRDEQGEPVSEANVELLGTPCVSRTDLTGGFDFASCDPVALARLSDPRVFVRFPWGSKCYGIKLIKPPHMTEIKIPQRDRCPSSGTRLKPRSPTKPPTTPAHPTLP